MYIQPTRTPRVIERITAQLFHHHPNSLSQHLPSHRLRPGKQRTIHCIHNRLCRDRPATKEASVQTLHSLLTARDSVELDVDIALSVRIERKMYDVPVLLLAFFADVVFELFDPVFASLPRCVLVR